MYCSFCGKQHSDSDSFCSGCGKKLAARPPYSDFELGRIAALDTIKKDFWSWFGTGFVVLGALLGLLALLGGNELVKNAVSDSVKAHLEAIQKTIGDATSKAVEASARADLETKKVDSTLADLDERKTQLEQSIKDTDQKKADLNRSIGEVSLAKQDGVGNF